MLWHSFSASVPTFQFSTPLPSHIGKETQDTFDEGEWFCFQRIVQLIEKQGPEDSFNFFRSDFIHLSISLASSTRVVKHHHHHHSSSLHLTPKSFAHFWSWCALFDGVLSLPIRQGTYYPPRLISPKFGRHLATVKYRVHLRRLFVSHAYIDESRESK